MLHQIFSSLPWVDRVQVLPLVCQRWHTVLTQPSMVWEDLNINFEALVQAGQTDAFLEWTAARQASIRSLNTVPRLHLGQKPPRPVRDAAADALCDAVAVIGPHLRTLRVHDLRQESATECLLKTLKRCTSLTYLDLNNATVLPGATFRFLRRLPHLCELRLTQTVWECETACQRFVTALCGATALASLNIKIEGDIDLPEEISRLQGLRSLTLATNGKTVLPESITTLRSLESLRLHGYHMGSAITHHPRESALVSLTALTSVALIAHSPCMPAVPTDICFLPALATLSISLVGRWGQRAGEQADVAVPEQLSRLTSLRSLTMNKMSLRDIPAPVLHLSGLRTLTLARNVLSVTGIPTAAAALPQLHTLDVCRPSPIGDKVEGPGDAPLLEALLQFPQVARLQCLELYGYSDEQVPEQLRDLQQMLAEQASTA